MKALALSVLALLLVGALLTGCSTSTPAVAGDTTAPEAQIEDAFDSVPSDTLDETSELDTLDSDLQIQ